MCCARFPLPMGAPGALHGARYAQGSAWHQGRCSGSLCPREAVLVGAGLRLRPSLQQELLRTKKVNNLMSP